MRKRFTKIICVTTAVISAVGVGLLSACGTYKQQSVGADTSATKENIASNGGFAVQTGDYLYFINGKETYTADNTFGSVVKGSIQRISKADLKDHNYTNTQTIVPMVVYSGNYDSGIYIYGDYIYYSSPSTNKDVTGETQNQLLEFRRTTLDGSETMSDYYFQSTSNSVAYRYVECDDVVYLVYAMSETLYGSSTTNIHSINTQTGVDTILAYNVSDYLFDSEDLENPYIYYTMDVTTFLGSSNSITESYNQLYRVKADAVTSPREYDFSYISDFDADSDPLYINLGEYVLDGIGIIENADSTHSVTQFNYGYYNDKDYSTVIDYHDYTYTLSSYKSGKLLFTRAENIGDSPSTSVYSVTDSQITESWDAIEANNTANANSIDLVLTVSDSVEYSFVTINNTEKVVYVGDNGIMVGEITGGKLQNEYIISDASSAEIIALRTEKTSETEEHLYAYYSGTKDSTEGYYRIAVDGAKTDYERNKYPAVTDATTAYKDVRLLDISVTSSWYAPEFVDNQIIFASATEGMSDYNYIMALDLSGTDGYIMTNKQLSDYNDKYNAVFTKIAAYDDELNADGSSAYENLSNSLKYLFYTGDSGYLAELIQAYVDIEDRDEEYYYSKESAQKYLDYANVENDWADYASDSKTVNGKTVYANSQDYYYSVLGKLTDDDATAIQDGYKSSYMKDYPTSTESWWDGLATWVKVIFIVGVSLGGLLLIGGAVILTLWLIKRSKAKKGGDDGKKRKVEMDVSKEEYDYSEGESAPAADPKKDNTGDKE